ncbi:MAG TPA: thiamine pyrophosphate-binding protein [Solirubrobacteraceae bacterium]|nr:thiamine pyrophosphate-binding protein [Solirubrobacteraceae bacterium]
MTATFAQPLPVAARSGYVVGDYLLDRLAELGVEHVFGVPGDYTLGLLDRVVAHPRVGWVGTTNELNAGYAADGYGRARGLSALMTTFGVGELSAINAVTGSFAEHVPVLHIVGAPSSGTQAAQRIVHHSLGDGVFTHFLDMHAPITCARAALTAANAAEAIDRVITSVRDAHLPGYLLLPADVAEAPASAPAAPLRPASDPTDPEALTAFRDAAESLLSAVTDAGGVSVLGGLLAHRSGATPQFRRLVKSRGLAHATSLWAKSLVDESDPNYLGIYAGAASDPPVRFAIESAEALIVAGVQFTDLNSGFFSHRLDRRRTIELGATEASIGQATFSPVSMGRALESLTGLAAGLPRSRAPHAPRRTATRVSGVDDRPLTQTRLWDAVSEWLAPRDVVVADQGTSFYGAGNERLPEDVLFLGQPLWASIGYSLPALLGACLAEPGRHGVLLIGDGAAQMTVPELSTIARLDLAATVIVVNNDGYTVERAIHGPDQPYNDIAQWDWPALMGALAPRGGGAVARRVTTSVQLRDALRAARATGGVSLIEAVLPRMDVPPLLAQIAREARRANTAVRHG